MSTQKKAKRLYGFEPDYAVSPAKTLLETLETLKMTQKELAIRTGLTEQTIVRILKSEQPITFETANKLEMVTNVPARLWNTMEMNYRQQLSKLKQAKTLEHGIDWLKEVPVKELMMHGYISKESSGADLVHETLKFYGVSSVDSWNAIWNEPKVAARRSDCFDTQPGPASAWIRLGEVQAQGITTSSYRKEKFKDALLHIRELTTRSPSVFIDEMRTLCSDSGVALSLVKEVKEVPWNGASKWLSPDKAMILLSLRGKGEDLFWSSFFHEAYHILHGEKQRLYIAEKNSTDTEEQKADHFAAEILIPARFNEHIASCTSKQEIIKLAQALIICPGIVADRYRHLTQRWTYFTDLTQTFDWTDNA
ncbi:MAG: helix-turn-helix domain-containing protein [Sphaerochaeta sp.]|nr:helix-turn-helix domain-containing protein [Sphaerochaeta sp.]